MGESLLALFQPGDTKDRLDRPELWWALLLALASSALRVHRHPPEGHHRSARERCRDWLPARSSRSPGSGRRARPHRRPRNRDRHRPWLHPLRAERCPRRRRRHPAWRDRISASTSPGSSTARGMFGASPELWIPFEAVMSVYPETQSAFLAIKGDETEHFGWNVPPESVRRGPARGGHEL